MPPRAVDHVVVVEVRESPCVTCGNHRRTVMRSGNWLRDERIYAERSESRYADFASGTSFRIVRDRAGVIQHMSVERFGPAERFRIVRRAPSGRRDTALGEPCEIWSVIGQYYNEETCETPDGIQLWSRFPNSGGAGGIPDSARVVSLERRPLRPEEVRPPADFFRLALWHEGRDEPVAGEPDYEVRLGLAGARRRAEHRIRRRHGAWHAEERTERDGVRSLSMGNGTAFLSYHDDGAGRPVKLDVTRRGYGLTLDSSGWERVRGRAPQVILGQSCTWQQPARYRSTDPHFECLTPDGMPLVIEHEWHWTGEREVYRACSISRRPLATTDFAPPPAAVDWANWGIAPPP